MAKDINLVIKLKNLASKGLDKVTGAFKGVSDSVKGAGDSAKRAESPFRKLGNFLKARFVITLGDLVRIGKQVISFFSNLIDKAGEHEQAVTSLNQALRNQRLFTDELTQALQKQAGEYQKVTKFSDEQIIKLQAQLINYGLMPDQINRATQATLDLAEGAFKGQLEPAMDAIVKTLGSTTNALARYGIQTDGAVGSTERLNNTIDSISNKFGGQALAQANDYTGSMTRLNAQLDDLRKKGGFVLQAVLKPWVDAFIKISTKANQFLGFLNILQDTQKEYAQNVKGWSDEIVETESKNTNQRIREIQRLLQANKPVLDAIKEEEKERQNANEQIVRGNAVILTDKEALNQDLLNKEKELNKELKELRKQQQILTEEQSIRRAEAQRKDDEKAKAEAEKRHLEEIKEIERKYNKIREIRDLDIEDEIAKNEELLALNLHNEDERNTLLIRRRELLARKTLEIETKLEEEKQKMRQMFNDLEVIGTATKSKELVAIAKAMAVTQATIDAHSAWGKAWASLPFPANVLPASMALAQGLANVATIASTPVKFADGGVVKATQGGQTGNINGVNSTVAENRSDEAIIPLEDDARVKELMGGGQTVVNLIIDGQKLAQAVVNGYNKGRNLNTVTKIKER